MHRFKVVGLALLAVFAFAAVAAATASAETPSVNVLPGEKVSELTYSGKAAKESKLETANGKTISCATTKVSATFEGEKEISTKGKATIDFEGCKKEKVACRSETAGGVKDAVEIILTPLVLTAADEETAAKALQFLLVNTLSETLLINCGGVKEEVKGNVGCLVTPALTEVAAGGTVTIECAIEPKGKQKTGTCLETKAACEKLKNEPLLGNLGAGFEASAEEINVAGTFNKMVTLID